MEANRFRFRSWDGSKMYEPETLSDIYNNGYACSGDIYDQDGFVIMQSTGLLDSYGKEIFEGDISRFSKNGVTWRGLCQYYMGSFVWSNLPRMIRFSPVGSESNGEVEIIGNKFENPDLLNQQPDKEEE